MAAQAFQHGWNPAHSSPSMQVKVTVMIEAMISIIFCPISCNLPFYNY